MRKIFSFILSICSCLMLTGILVIIFEFTPAMAIQNALKPAVKPTVRQKTIMQHPPKESGALPDLAFSKVLTVRKSNYGPESDCRSVCQLLYNETYIFTAEVTNIGETQSRPCNLLFKILTRETDYEHFQDARGRVFHADVPALFPNTIARIPLTFKLPNTGMFYLYALVDSRKQNHESDEANNLTQLGQQLAFNVRKPYVDFELSASVDPSKTFKHLSTVESVKISILVRNNGTIPSRGGKVEVVYHNSRAGTKRFDLPALEPNQSSWHKRVSHRFRGPGNKHVTVRVISSNGGSDAKPVNNIQELRFHVY